MSSVFLEVKIKLDALLLQNGIKNFTAQEILNPILNSLNNTLPPESLFDNIIPTLLICDSCRNEIGIPLTFNSVYRSTSYNILIKGSQNSLHCEFNACDIRPFRNSYENLNTMKEFFIAERFSVKYKGNIITPKDCGIGIYRTFVHIDTRGLLGRQSPARWQV